MPEPYLRATPSRSEQQGFLPSAAPLNDRAFDHGHHNGRVEPAFEQQPAVLLPELAFEPASEATPVSTALSVEDQLTELLGDVAPSSVLPDNTVPIAAPLPATKPAVDFAAKLMGRPSQTEPVTPAQPQPDALELMQRPGFTVSRDGYVPGEAQPMQTIAGSATTNAERDPFDFDLGPSPFQLKAAAAPAIEDPVPAVIETAPATEPEARAAIAEPDPVQPAPFVMPSVAATIPKFEAELAAVAASTLNETVHAPEAALAQPVETAAASADVLGAPEFALTSSARAELTSPVSPKTSAGTELSIAPQTSLSPSMQRSMEDTVADLLRPMLKTWLADNMPKIVERALRREMSERNLSEHKTAAE